MRLLAIGDIHGCCRALDALLAAIDPRPEDQIIPLGDYVDRGPASRQVLDRLIVLAEQHRLIPILGNHDQMMLEARSGDPHRWRKSYGKQTLASYAAPWEDDPLDAVPDNHWGFLESCRPYHETEDHIFVHAGVYPEIPMDEQPDFMLRWEGLNPELTAPHASGKTVICGHSAQRSGRPLHLGHTVCIDTYAHGGGWLTALEAQSGRLWRAREADGQVEEAWIDDF